MIEEDSLPAAPVRNNSSIFKNRVWRYGPAVIWALLIFIGSSDLLSSSHTSSFLIGPLHALFPGASEATLAAIHFTIRKLGHFTEYAILALLTARALRSSSRARWRGRWFWISLTVVIVYSLSDEFHQSFVDSRTASIFDCMIDTAGGLTALAIVTRRVGHAARRKRGSSLLQE